MLLFQVFLSVVHCRIVINSNPKKSVNEIILKVKNFSLSFCIFLKGKISKT